MIKLLVLDVDGCLSDGKISYTNNLDEIKSFDVKDGLGIASWIRLNNKVAIITGRKSQIVEKRAKELKVDYVFQGIKNKFEILEDILKKESISLENVAAIGDDMNDLLLLKKVKWSFAPNDGTDFIKEHVDTVLDKKGGRGAVREMIDKIISKNGQTQEFIKLWS